MKSQDKQKEDKAIEPMKPAPKIFLRTSQAKVNSLSLTFILDSKIQAY
jgi:hypothetical protein